MATPRIVEEESGIYRPHRIHRHNGYYAGDFSAQTPTTFGPTRPEPAPSSRTRACAFSAA